MTTATLRVFGSDICGVRTKAVAILAVRATYEGLSVVLTERDSLGLRDFLPSPLIDAGELELYSAKGLHSKTFLIALAQDWDEDRTKSFSELIADYDLVVVSEGSVPTNGQALNGSDQSGLVVGGYDGLLLKSTLALGDQLKGLPMVGAVPDRLPAAYARNMEQAQKVLASRVERNWQLPLFGYSPFDIPKGEDINKPMWKVAGEIVVGTKPSSAMTTVGNNPSPDVLAAAVPTTGSANGEEVRPESTPQDSLAREILASGIAPVLLASNEVASVRQAYEEQGVSSRGKREGAARNAEERESAAVAERDETERKKSEKFVAKATSAREERKRKGQEAYVRAKSKAQELSEHIGSELAMLRGRLAEGKKTEQEAKDEFAEQQQEGQDDPVTEEQVVSVDVVDDATPKVGDTEAGTDEVRQEQDVAEQEIPGADAQGETASVTDVETQKVGDTEARTDETAEAVGLVEARQEQDVAEQEIPGADAQGEATSVTEAEFDETVGSVEAQQEHESTEQEIPDVEGQGEAANKVDDDDKTEIASTAKERAKEVDVVDAEPESAEVETDSSGASVTGHDVMPKATQAEADGKTDADKDASDPHEPVEIMDDEVIDLEEEIYEDSSVSSGVVEPASAEAGDETKTGESDHDEDFDESDSEEDSVFSSPAEEGGVDSEAVGKESTTGQGYKITRNRETARIHLFKMRKIEEIIEPENIESILAKASKTDLKIPEYKEGAEIRQSFATLSHHYLGKMPKKIRKRGGSFATAIAALLLARHAGVSQNYVLEEVIRDFAGEAFLGMDPQRHALDHWVLNTLWLTEHKITSDRSKELLDQANHLFELTYQSKHAQTTDQQLQVMRAVMALALTKIEEKAQVEGNKTGGMDKDYQTVRRIFSELPEGIADKLTNEGAMDMTGADIGKKTKEVREAFGDMV